MRVYGENVGVGTGALGKGMLGRTISLRDDQVRSIFAAVIADEGDSITVGGERDRRVDVDENFTLSAAELRDAVERPRLCLILQIVNVIPVGGEGEAAIAALRGGDDVEFAGRSHFRDVDGLLALLPHDGGDVLSVGGDYEVA